MKEIYELVLKASQIQRWSYWNEIHVEIWYGI